MNRKNKHGFTLIELLVVIAIIAVLMSIMMPALTRARTQAKSVICKANVKQWGSIIMMYVNDNEDKFFPGPGSSPDRRWMELLLPYYASGGDGKDTLGQIRCCPAATKPTTEGGKHPYAAWGKFTDTTDVSIEGHYGSYGVNWWLCDVSKTPSGTYYPGIKKAVQNWRKLSNISSAANVPMFTDAGWYGVWPQHTDAAPTFNGEITLRHMDNEMRNVCLDRHLAKVNMVNADMSVQAVGLKELWKLKWHRKFDTSYPEQTWPLWLK